MQTFLPYPSFAKSAAVLDSSRLGCQRKEGKQILECLLGIGSVGWQNHPAVKQWKGSELHLAKYILTICSEWSRRGYADFVMMSILHILRKTPDEKLGYAQPVFLGVSEFHDSHKAVLLAKDFEHYSTFNWSVEPGYPDENGRFPYLWLVP